MLATILRPWILDGVYLAVFFAVSLTVPRLRAYYLAHTTAQERSVLSGLAEAAVPYVSEVFASLTGAAKFDRAVGCVLRWLDARGIAISQEEVQAEVQRAYDAARGRLTGAGTGATKADATAADTTPAP
jgi:hypothetical protein